MQYTRFTCNIYTDCPIQFCPVAKRPVELQCYTVNLSSPEGKRATSVTNIDLDLNVATVACLRFPKAREEK